MPDDPRLDRLEGQLDRLRDTVAEIERSGTRITQREIERIWEKAREIQGDIAHLGVGLDRKADALDLERLSGHVAETEKTQRGQRFLLLLAVVAAALSLAGGIILHYLP